jgi:chemotaxis protein CheY-P-specific phosphatase CheC
MPEVAKIKGLDIRDKKIADSTAVISVAQTDSIRMTTTNGEEVFIARDSFVDAIASVFKSNAKSSITSLFGELTESNVSSVGSINMSNLASVLSGLLATIIFGSGATTTDCNTLPVGACYCDQTVSNRPTSNGGCLTLRVAQSRKWQLYCTLNGKLFFRYQGSSGWGSWNQIYGTE